MLTRKFIERFKTALHESGEKIIITIDKKPYRCRAVVENAGKNFMRKYDDDEHNAPIYSGTPLQRDKIAFIPYVERIVTTPYDVFVTYRNKRYVVVADSTMYIKDEPLYIWALLREVVKTKEGYYNDIEQ